MQKLLKVVAERAASYLERLAERDVVPSAQAIERLAELDQPLPEQAMGAADVLALLDEIGSPATVASAGGRYFGFVTGSTLPAALVANWMAGAWDQNVAFRVMSPIAVKIEDVARRWLLDALGLPEASAVGFVTAATTANFSALAAARHALLHKQGWDVEAQGLFGAPPINVVVSDEVHASMLKALGLIGFGRERVTRVPVDGQGRMRADKLPPLNELTLVCIQAGNVNTGAFDPAEEICAAAREAGAWVHVDGAFGLWVAASPKHQHLTHGYADADSWALDAHKWLNVPYDSGILVCRHADAVRAAMTATASYLVQGEEREPSQYTPEFSRRARGLEVWAALQSLGRAGLADLIERTCRHAARFAEGLREAGCQILNNVVINQVLVSFGAAETTRRVIDAVQREGTCWAGATVWQGHTAMRISVSSWATTEEDVERSLEAIVRLASEYG